MTNTQANNNTTMTLDDYSERKIEQLRENIDTVEELIKSGDTDEAYNELYDLRVDATHLSERLRDQA